MTTPLLTATNLSKNFGGVAAVNNITLDVYEGETLAIIGPNGAGKTTFYNMLSGRMPPSSGTIRFKNQDITGLPPHQISRLGISRSFQINNIFTEMTVRENVEVAISALQGDSRKWFNIATKNHSVQQQADALLEQLGLTHLTHHRAGIISYGDKRLVEIAVVLATKPELVLLDEPTAGMTPGETRQVTALIHQLSKTGQYTFVITEHDMNVVFDVAHRILVMHRGQNLALGTPEMVKQNTDVRKAYLGEEIEEELA